MDALMNWSRAGESSATTFGEVREQLLNYFINPAIWTQLLVGGLKIIVIVIAGRLTIKIANKALHHILMAKEKGPLKFDTRRANTFGKLIGNIISYVVNFIMILMILNLFGFRLEPLLAGAGVIGLAVGFGAQSLVKDVITGFFIIFEDQFSVGDVIQINTYKGTVEEIGLRITKIKSWTGEVYIIPNGTISQVTNFSLYNSLAVVDVSVSYEEDIDKAMEVLKTSVHNFFEKSENIVLEPEVLGVQKLGASEVILRVIAECKPNTHAPVARELNGEIKRAFKDAGIAIPYPKLITYHRGEGAEETWKKSSTN